MGEGQNFPSNLFCPKLNHKILCQNYRKPGTNSVQSGGTFLFLIPSRKFFSNHKNLLHSKKYKKQPKKD